MTETGGSFIGAGATSGGSFIYPASGSGTSFTDLAISAQLVADATAAPTDTPTTDVLRVYVDASNIIVIWIYDTAAAIWRGIRLGSAI